MAGPDALLLKALQPPCRPAALGKLREGVVRPFPRELVRDPDLACRREVIRGIEGCRRNVDGVRFRITLIRQRGTAPAAECASYAGGRTKTGGLRSGKHEVARTKNDPRYGRGTCSEPAGPAVTKRCDNRHAVDAVSDCPAQATTLYDSICHVSSCRWTSIRGRRRTLRQAVALRRRPRRSLDGLITSGVLATAARNLQERSEPYRQHPPP